MKSAEHAESITVKDWLIPPSNSAPPTPFCTPSPFKQQQKNPLELTSN